MTQSDTPVMILAVAVAIDLANGGRAPYGKAGE
jgi:hypothetical protein